MTCEAKMTSNTAWIPKDLECKFKAELSKFNKKAKKLNCPEVTYSIRGEKSIIAPGYEQKAKTWGENSVPHIQVIEIELIGEGPRIEGWKFLGTLDHRTLPGSVIINTVPGEEIPQLFHNTDASCDHCGKVRKRNETFVLQEDATGDFKRVGRQCVRDFIGYDPNSVFRYVRMLSKFVEDISNDDRWSVGGGGGFFTFDAIDVLIKTAAIIDRHGWVPRSAIDENNPATADRVMDAYFPPEQNDRQYRSWKEWVSSLNLDRPKWAEEANAAREWLQGQPSNNEYMHNLHAINEVTDVPTRLFGYWCSLMSAYYRNQEKLRLAEREAKLNEHVGNIKERRDFIVTLKKRRSFENDFGTVRLHVFRDEKGRTLTWWASVDPDMEVDGQYKIKGTIKEHGEYNDWAQTVLTRVKVLEKLNGVDVK